MLREFGGYRGKKVSKFGRGCIKVLSAIPHNAIPTNPKETH
jgi:hypothetical protein